MGARLSPSWARRPAPDNPLAPCKKPSQHPFPVDRLIDLKHHDKPRYWHRWWSSRRRAVRKEHKEEADEIVNDAYKKFQDLSKSGLSLETASKAYEVLADLSKRVAELSGDAIGTIVDNHPQLKEKFGGNIEQLKSMGEKYSPEAKNQVDETWKEVRNVLGGGLSVANLDKIRKLIEEKVQQVQKLGDQAWQKGYEEIKPQLEK